MVADISVWSSIGDTRMIVKFNWRDGGLAKYFGDGNGQANQW